MKVTPSPVKAIAQESAIPVITVTTLKDEAVIAKLRTFDSDVFVVAAFGLILTPEVLNTPARGCVNVHLSALPHLRGAAPAEWAIINGLRITGATIMLMDEGLDTGPILDQVDVTINGNDKGGTLLSRLSEVGAELLIDVLDRIDEIVPIPQDDSQASYAPMITTADAEIDWPESSSVIERKIRGFDPRPGAWSMLGNKRLKIFGAKVIEADLAPGELQVNSSEMAVGCGDGALAIEELQLEGKAKVNVAEFLRGARLAGVTRLGAEDISAEELDAQE